MTPSIHPSGLLTVAEIASMMRVSKMTIYRAIHDKELRALRLGREFRVPEKALSEYLRSNDTFESGGAA